MEYTVKINISEIIDNSTEDEKFSLFKELLFDRMSNSTNTKSIKWLLNDLLECEFEFDNRIDIIEAYKTLIKSLDVEVF